MATQAPPTVNPAAPHNRANAPNTESQELDWRLVGGGGGLGTSGGAALTSGFEVASLRDGKSLGFFWGWSAVLSGLVPIPAFNEQSKILSDRRICSFADRVLIHTRRSSCFRSILLSFAANHTQTSPPSPQYWENDLFSGFPQYWGIEGADRDRPILPRELSHQQSWNLL